MDENEKRLRDTLAMFAPPREGVSQQVGLDVATARSLLASLDRLRAIEAAAKEMRAALEWIANNGNVSGAVAATARSALTRTDGGE